MAHPGNSDNCGEMSVSGKKHKFEDGDLIPTLWDGIYEVIVHESNMST
jgi:hypothetical protein